MIIQYIEIKPGTRDDCSALRSSRIRRRYLFNTIFIILQFMKRELKKNACFNIKVFELLIAVCVDIQKSVALYFWERRVTIGVLSTNR